MENIITVHFAAGQTQAVAPGALYQWAYGQTLKIEGLQLPTAYQVDFSNFEFCGSSIPRIGGADGVTVPAEVLATGQPVFAFIWLQNQNAGRTWYRIMIRVIPRPAPDPDEPNPEEESAIAEAIAALNDAVAAAETAETNAEASAADAAAAAQDAAASAVLAESWAVGDTGTRDGENQNNAKFWALMAQQGAEQAEESADSASNSAAAAGVYASDAHEAASNAEQSKEDAEQAKVDAAQSASTAASSAATATTKASEASASASAASGSASQAATSATNAGASATAAAASATAAAGSASTANTKAGEAASSATAAANAQTAAETAQGAAEDAQAAAEAVLASIPEDYTELAEDVGDLKSALDETRSRVFKTIEETKDASIILAAGQYIAVDTPVLYFNVPANTEFSWKVEHGPGTRLVSGVYKTDVNGTRSALMYSPVNGREYTATSSTEISFFSLYVDQNDVSAETTVTLTVSYSIENENSLEEKADTAITLAGEIPTINERLNTEVFSPQENLISDKSYSVTAGSGIPADETEVPVSFSAGSKFKFKLNTTNGCVTKYFVYFNGHSDYSDFFPNYEYLQTAEQEITSIKFLIDSAYAAASGTASFSVTELVDHPDAIEARLTELSSVSDYVPTGIMDGYTVVHVVENGTFNSSGVLTTGNPNQIRTGFIQFKTGDKFVVESGSLLHGCAMWEGTPSSGTNRRMDYTFRAGVETITAEYDGFIVFAFKRENGAAVSLSDFDGAIKLYNTLVYKAALAASVVQIPSYYEANNYIKGKAERINTLGAVGDDVFVFITDVHWERNAKHSPGLINYLSNDCKIARLFDGGDVADMVVPTAIRAYRKNFDGKIYRVCGNHDWFPPETGKSLYYWLNSENNDQIGKPFAHYWYVDNVQQKIRYVTLNSFKHTGNDISSGWEYGFDADQIAWFTNEALNVPNGFDVIVFSHYFRTKDGGDSGYDSIESAIANFNANTGAHGEVICIFQGHLHYDAVFHTSSGVPVITTTCDKYDISNEPYLAEEVRTLGTINEQVFDVCILNREAKTITCVRVGAQAQNNIDVGRTDEGFTFAQTLEERVVSYN